MVRSLKMKVAVIHRGEREKREIQDGVRGSSIINVVVNITEQVLIS